MYDSMSIAAVIGHFESSVSWYLYLRTSDCTPLCCVLSVSLSRDHLSPKTALASACFRSAADSPVGMRSTIGLASSRSAGGRGGAGCSGGALSGSGGVTTVAGVGAPVGRGVDMSGRGAEAVLSRSLGSRLRTRCWAAIRRMASSEGTRR